MASITPLASGRGLPDLSVVEFAIMIALLRLGPRPAPLLLGTLSEWFGQDVTLSDIQPGVRRLVHQHFLRLEAGGTLRPQARSVSPVATSFSASSLIDRSKKDFQKKFKKNQETFSKDF